MTRIVVVDDDHSTSALIKMLLEMEGFTVATYRTTQAALADADAGAAALIIDCHLSGKESGLDLLRAIRQGETPIDPDVPVIMASGDQRLAEEVSDSGADLFLLKPYSPNDLSAHINRLLAAER